MSEEWYSLPIDEVFRKLGTTSEGLSKVEAKERLLKYGLNELKKTKRRSPIKIFLMQFTDFLVIILLVATVISFFLGEIIDAVVIAAIVIINAIIGFIQEYKAEKAIEALKQMAAPKSIVIRDKHEIEITSRELVPGDIIYLNTGNRVPADIRLFDCTSLKVDESSLTGESVPVEKNTNPIDVKTPLADRVNMVYMGTIITFGHGKGVVVATGMNTEIGKIAGMIQEEEEKETPLQRRLSTLGKKLGQIVLILCGIVFLAGFLRGFPLIEMFLTSVSLAVAAIPEGLPAIVTMGLALGVQRMAKKNAIIRRLPAVETLGCSTIICSDKTGTLTKNEMTVRKVYVGDKIFDVTGRGYAPNGEFLLNGNKINPLSLEDLKFLLEVGVLSNDSVLSFDPDKKQWFVSGDPTSGAIIVLAEKAGIKQADILAKFKRLAEIPFDSERKRITTINKTPEGEKVICISGAFDIILNLSKY
ncbi:MAG: cation-translocating P-type ATPase, partial [Candidatus Odinarchaeia archaeon]